MSGSSAARSERVIREVRRWLRQEGALSASVALPDGRGVVVYRSKKIEEKLARAAEAKTA